MSKKLVAYFSASGVTKKVAEKIAEAADGDLYEITPEQLYTNEDLDWQNNMSRSSVEMKDKNFRPAIKGKVENIAQYDTLLIGFPIWWYVAPTIINTFLESYELKGKKIVLFATSGMSGMGKTAAELKVSALGAEIVAEKRLEAAISQVEVEKWVGSLKI